MEEEKEKKKWWQDNGHSDEALKHWRSWGSWYSWGSATGFAIFLLSIGGFIYLLHLAGLVGR